MIKMLSPFPRQKNLSTSKNTAVRVLITTVIIIIIIINDTSLLSKFESHEMRYHRTEISYMEKESWIVLYSRHAPDWLLEPKLLELLMIVLGKIRATDILHPRPYDHSTMHTSLKVCLFWSIPAYQKRTKIATPPGAWVGLFYQDVPEKNTNSHMV